MLPETKSYEIVEKLSAYRKSETIPDEMAAAGLKREIKKLTKIDAGTGHMISGMLNCILGNLDDCIRDHERSIAIRGDGSAYYNYIASITEFNMFVKIMGIIKNRN